MGTMFFALYRVLVLRGRIPGGKVKKTWNILSGMIALFSAGYLATPFFPLLPQVAKDLLVGVIFFFGAVFVVIVTNLFYRVVSDLGL